MKKYKLLKEMPNYEVGDIFEESKSITDFYNKTTPSCIYMDDGFYFHIMENNPDWFEEVKEPEFKKEFTLFLNDRIDRIELWETFETQEQAKAEKALREHIYKFPEPEPGELYRLVGVNMFSTGLSYVGDDDDKRLYKTGLIMSVDVTKEDEEERIRLIKQSNKY